MLHRYKVAGVPIAALNSHQAALHIVERASAKASLEVHLCNAYTLSLVDRDDRLRDVLLRPHCVNLADGTPVAILGRRHGVTGPVRGPRLVSDVAELGLQQGVSHYFYGGAPGVADELAETLQRRFPSLLVAGVESPPYGDPDPELLKAASDGIRRSGASVLWVGLGTPRQDYVVPMLARELACPVVPVGAAFDFITGRIKQAPSALHGSGLEWLFRLAQEPRRLTVRYLVGNPRFLAAAWKHRNNA
jgi:N-acetylglucosaminyldiphosphoundecaprenol N-acetyl-beta-D-mannosaminyltransferase